MYISSVNVIVPIVSWSIAFGDRKQHVGTSKKEYEKYVHKKSGSIDRTNSITGRKYCNIAKVYFQNRFFGCTDECYYNLYDSSYPIPLAMFFHYKAESVLFRGSVL